MVSISIKENSLISALPENGCSDSPKDDIRCSCPLFIFIKNSSTHLPIAFGSGLKSEKE
jgi:hypothetical protein